MLSIYLVSGINMFNAAFLSLDYLKFWINTIVTYCKGSRPGFPKIMIVLTHKDKVKSVSMNLSVFLSVERHVVYVCCSVTVSLTPAKVIYSEQN